MKKVNVSGLKSHLSHYLRVAKNGEEVLIMDRREIIARLVRFDRSQLGAHDALRLERLVAEGAVTPPAQKLPKNFFTKMPKSRRSVVQAALDEREDGR